LKSKYKWSCCGYILCAPVYNSSSFTSGRRRNVCDVCISCYRQYILYSYSSSIIISIIFYGYCKGYRFCCVVLSTVLVMLRSAVCGIGILAFSSLLVISGSNWSLLIISAVLVYSPNVPEG